jgi:biopolymer transport protein ExbD
MNVTPLIDVLLVLLITFMVVSPLKPAAFRTTMPHQPNPETVPPIPNPDTLVLNIDGAARVTLNKVAAEYSVDSAAPLIERLKRIFTERERNLSRERTVFIRAPKGLDYGSVVKVVDAAKMAGAQPISLQIDRLD